MKLSNLRVKIYADGADLKSILRLNENPLIQGFTTNPTLMRRAGVENYGVFGQAVLNIVDKKPVSFEVLSDEFETMFRQAMIMHNWAPNVYVKIPVTNSKGESSAHVIRELGLAGVKVNVTAILSLSQVTEVIRALPSFVPSVISVFAGRVADTGIDALALMSEARRKMRHQNRDQCELLWASVREPLNIYQAEDAGCHIITVPEPILKKAEEMNDRPLDEVSLETVKMFVNDAQSAGYTL